MRALGENECNLHNFYDIVTGGQTYLTSLIPLEASNLLWKKFFSLISISPPPSANS